MSRPLKKRNVEFEAEVTQFVPSGVPRCRLETVVFGADEIEALRLTDLEGLYQDQAAEVMGISRQTLGRILASARRKASEALTMGKAMHIRDAQVGESRDAEFRLSAGCPGDQVDSCGRNSSPGCGQPAGHSCKNESSQGSACGSGHTCGQGGNTGCR